MSADCIFCKIVKGEAPSWKVYETDRIYAFLDINPVNPYHTLVIPKSHYENIFDIGSADLQAVIEGVRLLSAEYKNQLGIQNIQIINSNGREAQQDVFHIHYHIVPRRLGDGQSIRWKTKPHLRSEFDQMLSKLNIEK